MKARSFFYFPLRATKKITDLIIHKHAYYTYDFTTKFTFEILFGRRKYIKA
jgi:hypothetical protein